MERFPWAGHIGLELLPEVVADIERAQRRWSSPTRARSARSGTRRCSTRGRSGRATIALHHGSLEREVREWVEDGLRDRHAARVVCTSSLDLGVDFAPVDRVIQIGSPKGVARLMQRAGRSGPPARRDLARHLRADPRAGAHRGRRCARCGGRRARSSRAPPLEGPLDVLVQHLVTCALGGGFAPDALLRRSARRPAPTAALDDVDWHWALDFVDARRREPERLSGVPARGRRSPTGSHRVPDARDRPASPHVDRHDRRRTRASPCACATARRSAPSRRSFVARLRPGDAFVFAGRRAGIRPRARDDRLGEAGAAAARPRCRAGAARKMPLSTLLARCERAR